MVRPVPGGWSSGAAAPGSIGAVGGGGAPNSMESSSWNGLGPRDPDPCAPATPGGGGESGEMMGTAPNVLGSSASGAGKRSGGGASSPFAPRSPNFGRSAGMRDTTSGRLAASAASSAPMMRTPSVGSRTTCSGSWSSGGGAPGSWSTGTS